MVLIVKCPKSADKTKNKGLRLSKKDKILLQLMVFGSDDEEITRILNTSLKGLAKMKTTLRNKLSDEYRVNSWNETVKICFEKKVIDIHDFMHADVKQFANYFTKKIYTECIKNKKSVVDTEDQMVLRIKDFISKSIHEMRIADIKNRYV